MGATARFRASPHGSFMLSMRLPWWLGWTHCWQDRLGNSGYLASLSIEAGGKRDPRGNRNFNLPIQVVPGQAGGRSFKIEMLIAYRVEQKLHP